MYVSLHRYGDGFYPGTGAIAEVGKGGTNVNVAWSEKGLGDADYLAAFDVVIEPVVKSFAPDLIIIAAGFDAADGDPLGGMMVSPTGYMHMTKRLIEIGTGRVVVALEGGYALRPLATCATATLRALLGDEPKPISSRSRPRKSSIKLCRELASLLARALARARERRVQEFDGVDRETRHRRRRRARVPHRSPLEIAREFFLVRLHCRGRRLYDLIDVKM